MLEEKTKDELEEELNKLYGDHYDHMCRAGYDPLVCSKMKLTMIDFGHGKLKYRTVCNFLDRVITREIYITQMKQAKIPEEKLDDIIFLNWEDWIQNKPYLVGARVALFWLRPPSGCRTLTQLFEKYRHKIDGELVLIDTK